MPASSKAIDSKILLTSSDTSSETVEAVELRNSEVEKRGNQAAAYLRTVSCWNHLHSTDTVKPARSHQALGVLCSTSSSETFNSTGTFCQSSSSTLQKHASARDEHGQLAILGTTAWKNHSDDNACVRRLSVGCSSQLGSACSGTRSAQPIDYGFFESRRNPAAAAKFRSLNKADLYLSEQIAMFEELQRQRRHIHTFKATCAELEQSQETRHMDRKDCDRQSSSPLQLHVASEKIISTNACDSQPNQISCQPHLALRNTDAAAAAASIALMYTDAAHMVIEKAPWLFETAETARLPRKSI